jgi:stage V sporulation protein G
MNQSQSPFNDFRITISQKDNLRALVSCKVADAVWITGIRVVEGSKGKFIAMPSRKDPKGEYQDVFFPATREMREQLQTAVLAKYQEAVVKAAGSTEQKAA